MENSRLAIRAATMDDLEVLLDFEQGVIAAERPLDADMKNGSVTYYDLPGLINDTDTQMLIAEIDGQAVASGYVQIRQERSHIRFSACAYIGFLYVAPEHRGKGINAQVLEAIKAWAKERKVPNLKLEVFHNNPSAIRAYEKAGFESRILEMRLDI